MCLLGIDLGTSAVKVILVSTDGQVVGRGSAVYPISRPEPDQAEQSPADWWTATKSAIQLAMGQAGAVKQDVIAIGLSGQMHGSVFLDRSYRLLGQAIIWPDRRSMSQINEIYQRVGSDRLIQITGSPVATGFQAATILWLQQRRPELWKNVRYILAPKDYLRWRMTGIISTEPSDGSGTLLFDVNHRDWSTEILDILSIEPCQLPPVTHSTEFCAGLARSAAEEMGLLAGIPVVSGAADTACSLLGAGVLNDDTLLVSISTGGQIILPTTEVEIDVRGRIHTFCSALDPKSGQAGWYQMAAILSAGMSLQWLRDEVFDLSGQGSFDQMIAWAEEIPPGANGLIFLPYLAGERSPHMDPLARGMFLGLTAGHGRGEMVRAVMEGVGLACYDAYSVLADLGGRPDHIIMAGGGASSPLWRQIVADIFNLPVQPLMVKEQSAMGACLLAGAGIGVIDLAEAAQKWAVYGPVVEPRADLGSRYATLLTIFRDAYRKHSDDFVMLNDID